MYICLDAGNLFIMSRVPKIKTEDAIALYDGVKYRLAKALKINPQAIDYWGEYVPDLRAYQLRDMHPEQFTADNK